MSCESVGSSLLEITKLNIASSKESNIESNVTHLLLNSRKFNIGINQIFAVIIYEPNFSFHFV